MKRFLLMAMMVAVSLSGMAQRPHDDRGRGGHGGMNRFEQHNRYDNHDRRACATREELKMTLKVLENQPFDDKKLEVAELSVVLGHFCTDDLVLMAKKFSFDDNRKQFLLFAYDYCNDPHNYYTLRDVFEFRNNFDEMMDALQSRRRR